MNIKLGKRYRNAEGDTRRIVCKDDQSDGAPSFADHQGCWYDESGKATSRGTWPDLTGEAETVWLVTVADYENNRHEVLGAFHTQEAAEKRFEQERKFALERLDENQIMEDQPRLLVLADSDFDDSTGYVLEAFEQEIESAPDTDLD